jgi:hypothetical protein
MKDVNKILENSVFTESVIAECKNKHDLDVRDKVNALLLEKAQMLGLSLYEVCSMYVPEITSEIVEIDWYKEKRDFPDIKVVTTIKLVPIEK